VPTPRGERRREALVEAAVRLLVERGFGAVSHRAVADRAGLPLAATTYYFASREDLVVAAVERLGSVYADHARAVLGSLPPAPQSDAAVAGLIVSLVVGADEPEPDALRTFYERYAEAGRQPALRGLVAAWTDELVAQVADVLRHYGRPAGEPVPRLLVAMVDGLLLTGLVAAEATAAARARADLSQVLAAIGSAARR
jgi:DNA-binding transcriptional regulator YbjK